MPRHRLDPPQEEDEKEHDAFDLEYHDNSDLDAYVAVMNEIEYTVPNSEEAKRKRAVVWDRLAYLAEAGVTTGSRLLDRMMRRAGTPLRSLLFQHQLSILNAKMQAKLVQ